MVNNMANKVFKTLNEQIEILKNKGLVVNNYEEAKEVLFRENYFFLTGYRHFFLKNNKFLPGTTFEELYSVFLFDRKIRNIMFKYILVIENNIKSIISYQLSKKYGFKEKDYLNIKNYNQDILKERQVADVVSKIKRQIRINGRNHSATIHYINNYGYLPLWIVVKVLSFGIMAEYYNILQTEDQINISDSYGISSNKLSIFLTLLANFRNLCAHEDILYNHKTQRPIPDDIIHQYLNIDKKDDEYIYGKNDLFALIIIMKYMLSKEEFKDLTNEISYEIDFLNGKVKTQSIDNILDKITFPSNWRNIINIRR